MPLCLSAEGYGRYLVAAHDTLRYEGGEDRPLVGLTGYVAESNADTVGAFPDGQAERVDGNPKLWDDFASTERVGFPERPPPGAPPVALGAAAVLVDHPTFDKGQATERWVASK